MAYIGQDPVIGRYILVDQISGGFNGTASGFTLAAGGQGVIPGLAQNVLLSLGGVIQQPGTDYTVSGSGITFTTPPLSGTTFFATVLGDVQAVGTPSDGTVLPASIATSGTFVFPNITTTGTTLIASGNASTPSLAVIGDTNTGLYSPGADQLSITTGGTERFRIDSAGQLEAVSLGTAAAPTFSFTTDPNTGIYSPGADQLAISTNGTGRLFVDASGRVLVGTSSARANLYNSTFTAAVQVEGTSYNTAGMLLTCNINDDTTCSVLNLAKSRGTTVGSNTLVSNGDTVGIISFSGNDGTEFVQTALIISQVDGTPSANDMPGRLVFSTTADGASSPTERMRITSAGLVGIGTSSPNQLLEVNGFIRGGSYQFGTSSTSIAEYIGFSNSNGPTLEFYGSATGLAGAFVAKTAGTERLRIDSSGRVGIGTSGPGALLNLQGTFGTSLTTGLRIDGLGSTTNNVSPIAFYIQSSNWGTQHAANIACGTLTGLDGGGYLRFSTSPDGNTAPAERLRITATGLVGIGTTSPSSSLVVSNSGANGIEFGPVNGDIFTYNRSTLAYTNTQITCNEFVVRTNGSNERARIDTSGRLLVGTSSTSKQTRALVQGNSGGGATAEVVLAADTSTPTGGIGNIYFSDNGHTNAAIIAAVRDGGTWTSGSSQPTSLQLYTTANGAASPTERMRISNDGRVNFGSNLGTSDVITSNVAGIILNSTNDNRLDVSRTGGAGVLVNRKTDDGALVLFYQDATNEGSISVSGTTVSYNGAHLSRWSQLPSGQEREEILRGSVLSNIDEMCEWGEENNEQLNRMKVSDVEGDKNVSGVFQAWDDDDDTYTNDFYCAMTGDFIIRIAEGVTVERGDLLMSAGDGTAKPQGDGYVQDKTIAKVTSTNVSCTYEDGSYCVPCVLMAC